MICAREKKKFEPDDIQAGPQVEGKLGVPVVGF